MADRRKMYDSDASKKARGEKDEPKKDDAGERRAAAGKREAKATGEQPKEPGPDDVDKKPELKDQDDAVPKKTELAEAVEGGDDVPGRHGNERDSMHQRHRTERRDAHGNYRTELDKMHSRHMKEMDEMGGRHSEELKVGLSGKTEEKAPEPPADVSDAGAAEA